MLLFKLLKLLIKIFYEKINLKKIFFIWKFFVYDFLLLNNQLINF